MVALLLILCLLALLFGFFDGLHGSGNVVATAIFSRSVPMHQMLLLAAAAVFMGPFLFGVAIAETIGQELTAPQNLTLPVTIAAVAAAVLWKMITGRLGLPASSSHSLIGGLVGTLMASQGAAVLQSQGLIKVAAALALSPICGLLAGYGMMRVMTFLTRSASPRVNEIFKRGQLATSFALAMSHGANDAQKTMSILALGLLAADVHTEFYVPLWIVAASAGSMSLGALLGGRRVIRTVGGKFYRVRPVHGFVSQITAATVILTAALLGGPVSTTQTISSSVVGVGAAERLSKVRWVVFYDITLAWVLTVPFTALTGAGLYFLVQGAVTLLRL